METIQQLEAYQRVKTRINQLQQKGKAAEAQKLIDILAEIESKKKDVAEPYKSSQREKNDFIEITSLLRETLQEIKFLVEIKAKPTISYDKITHEGVRKALRRDNLRMEQALFNITISDAEQFYSFCNNAFRQVENLLNYYYFKRFPDSDAWLDHFKQMGTVFQDDKIPKKLSQVQAHTKLYCFERIHYHDPEGKIFYDSQLDLIKQVRNLDAHRCDVFKLEYEKHYQEYQKLLETIAGFKKNGRTFPKEKKHLQIEREGKLAEFIKAQNFDLIRNELKVLYEKVVS